MKSARIYLFSDEIPNTEGLDVIRTFLNTFSTLQRKIRNLENNTSFLLSWLTAQISKMCVFYHCCPLCCKFSTETHFFSSLLEEGKRAKMKSHPTQLHFLLTPIFPSPQFSTLIMTMIKISVSMYPIMKLHCTKICFILCWLGRASKDPIAWVREPLFN